MDLSRHHIEWAIAQVAGANAVSLPAGPGCPHSSSGLLLTTRDAAGSSSFSWPTQYGVCCHSDRRACTPDGLFAEYTPETGLVRRPWCGTRTSSLSAWVRCR